MASDDVTVDLLHQIQESLSSLQREQRDLASSVTVIGGQVNDLSAGKGINEAAGNTSAQDAVVPKAHTSSSEPISEDSFSNTENAFEHPENKESTATPTTKARRPSLTSRIILTTYPGQAGIVPLPMLWGHKDPLLRGPVTVSRNSNTVSSKTPLNSLLQPM